MAEFSFDVVSRYESHELANALDQARREVNTRYDFKDTQTTIDQNGETVVVESASEDRARAAAQVVLEKGARRQLPVKLFKIGEPKTIGRGRGQVEIELNAGISDTIAK